MDEIQEEASLLRSEVVSLGIELTRVREEASRLHRESRGVLDGIFDRVPELRGELLRVRKTAEYVRTFEEKEPLVTVRMATYNRGDLLFERAVPSVLAQTYPRFELVIVGDGCTDDTEERLRGIGDARVRFVNMPHQAIYPTDPRQRWMVAGAPAMNLAAELARGLWIAPIDDDDEFTPDHLAVLLETALAGRFEMVCSRFASAQAGGDRVLGRYPPALGHFTFQAAMYMAELRMFEYETRAWLLDEPGDWNLCRRMLEAGVRIGWSESVLTRVHPTGPRLEGSDRVG
jgi:hypothetical protein